MPTLRIIEIPCLFCGKNLENMDSTGVVSTHTILKGGVLCHAEAIYGSIHDGDLFVLAVCDECLANTPSRVYHIKDTDRVHKIDYFHELTQDEVESLMSTNISLMSLNRLYKPPIWCGDKGALNIATGCAILMDWRGSGRTNISRSSCSQCKFFKNI